MSGSKRQRGPGFRFFLGHVVILHLFLFLVADVEAVDSRDPLCLFLRSRRRVLQLFFRPLLRSGYYHLLSGLCFPCALGRCGLTSPRSRRPGRRPVRHARCSSRSFVSSAAYARLRADARARRGTRRPVRRSLTVALLGGPGAPPSPADLHDVTAPGQLAQMPVNGRPGRPGSADKVTDPDSFYRCPA
jgi:hypothetical protein